MKFNCPKEELVQALQLLNKAIAVKTQNPILSGIYIYTENDLIIMQSTDNEMSVIISLQADIIESGEMLISGHYALEVIRRLPGANVTVELDKEQNLISIKSIRSNFSLLAMDANNYSKLDKVDGNISFTIKDRDLRNLILNTSFAAATDTGRPVFNGCLLELTPESIVMTATDSHRLAVYSVPWDGFTENKSIIIPVKYLNELQKALQADYPRDVKVCWSNNQISFEFDNVYMSSRIIEGQFPDYRRVIPADYVTKVRLNKNEIKGIVERMSLLLSNESKYKNIIMEFSGNNVKISANNHAIGQGEEYASALIDGEDIKVSFHVSYINDGLKNITSEEFYMSFNKPLSPVGMKQEDRPEFVYIVTPVRV